MSKRWSTRRLYWTLYPFTATAVAINLFLLGLIGFSIGLPAIPPVIALIAAVPLGFPANVLITRWVNGLLDEAES
ncbi:hypothetical protein KUH32_17955 [Thalassococcus sp. CAU 1522]|uniref:NnrT protein n=1 Tax=Thalassococcus arenae TaxID=2851652 RepID=A0ABS6NCA8_9RHOB|nr:hypothetical protein [Thalassococcus arenae]MBV2361654.1 hypothetical protein [Thalassococcus arenae]